LRAAIALERQWGHILEDKTDVMTLMDVLKLACPSPYFTDKEIRDWNKAPSKEIHCSESCLLKLLQASIGECEREDLWWMQEGMVLRT
jgi:hypothetical protein